MIGNLASVSTPAATVATSALAAPALAGDGADITPMRHGGFGPNRVLVSLDGSAAQIVTTAFLWGYRLSQWWKFKALNAGAVITIVGTDQGFAEIVDGAGIFERLAVSGTVSAGTTAQRFERVELLG